MRGRLLPSAPVRSLDEYLTSDTGGLGLRRAQDRVGTAATIDEVSRSGLRGRGGGGFPTGRQRAGVRAQGQYRKRPDWTYGEAAESTEFSPTGA